MRSNPSNKETTKQLQDAWESGYTVANQAIAHAVNAEIEREQTALANTARGYDDAIIDPRDTRTALGIALTAIREAT